MRAGRRLGVDVGDVRVGVATCDSDGLIATPVETVPAGSGCISRLAELAREYEVIEVVVGLPVSLSGGEGPAAAKVRRCSAIPRETTSRGANSASGWTAGMNRCPPASRSTAPSPRTASEIMKLPGTSRAVG